jgi:hypothetical protein
LHDAAADEVDAIVEPHRYQQDYRREVDKARKRDEEVALADKIEINVGGNYLKGHLSCMAPPPPYTARLYAAGHMALAR